MNLFIFLLLAVIYADPCLVFQNTYVSWKHLNVTTQTWTFGKHAQYEWVAFGFRNHDSHINLYLYNNSKLDEYVQQNQSLVLQRPINFVYVDGDEFWEKHIQVELQIAGVRQMFVTYELKGNNYPLPTTVNEFPHLQFKEVDLEHTENECVVNFAQYLGRNNIPLLSVGFVYTIVVAILCFVFRNKQPLKSRGWISHMILLDQFAQLVRLLIESDNYLFTREWYTKYLCLFVQFLFRPLDFASYFLIPVDAMRFFVINNLNNMKRMFINSDEKKITKKLKVLKVITAPWFSVIVVFLFWLFVMVFHLTMVGIEQFKCNRVEQSLALRLFMIITCGIIVILGHADVVIESLSHYKQLRNPYKFYIIQDPYLYRIQLAFTALMGGVLTFISAYVTMQPTVRQVLFTITFYAFFGSMSVFPLFLTIIRQIKRRFEKKTVADDDKAIEYLLKDEVARELFYEYAKREWSTENVLIYNDIERFKQSFENEKTSQIGGKSQLEFAKEIYEKYLKGVSAVFEVNIDRIACNKVYQQLKQNKVDVNLFQEVEVVIRGNLLDTFSRFKNSSEYLSYLKGMKEKEELARQSGII